MLIVWVFLFNYILIKKIMTVLESLTCISQYPTDLIASKLLIDRELDGALTYDSTYRTNSNYQLALADIYMYLYTAPDLKEQDITLTLATRDNYYNLAQKIYGKYDTSEYEGIVYGMIGKKLNYVQ